MNKMTPLVIALVTNAFFISCDDEDKRPRPSADMSIEEDMSLTELIPSAPSTPSLTLSLESTTGCFVDSECAEASFCYFGTIFAKRRS